MVKISPKKVITAVGLLTVFVGVYVITQLNLQATASANVVDQPSTNLPYHLNVPPTAFSDTSTGLYTLNLKQGGTAVIPLTLELINFDKTATLNFDATYGSINEDAQLPPGVTVTFAPQSLVTTSASPPTSTILVKADNSAPDGKYLLTIRSKSSEYAGIATGFYLVVGNGSEQIITPYGPVGGP